MWKSTDRGSGFTEILTPHGDNHDLWIDPGDPSRMVQGNDGGACVSFNAGITWSCIYNQPTAQFYRIDTDNRFPYRVFATQQDNTSIAVPSASYWGSVLILLMGAALWQMMNVTGSLQRARRGAEEIVAASLSARHCWRPRRRSPLAPDS